MGGQEALGIDIDPEAILASQENAMLNQMENLFLAETTPLAKVAGVFPLITANLTGPELIELAQLIMQKMPVDGMLIISGFLASQAASVKNAFSGLVMEQQASLNGWTALLLRKQ